MSQVVPIVKALFNRTRAVGQVRCGSENLGDIIVRQAIDHLMSGATIIVYDRTDPMMHLVESVIGLRRVLRYGMLGGGTLVFTPRHLGWLGTLENLLARTELLCVFGTGVVDPEFVARVYAAAGPRSPLDEEALEGWVTVLRRFPIVGVRGVESGRTLRDRGVGNLEVIGDPALVFARDEVSPKQCRKSIGVNILNESHFWPGSKERALGEMKSFLRNLILDGWEVHLMPACARDLALAEEFRANIGQDRLRIFSAFLQTNAYLAAVGGLDLFVGMRLHSYVAACCMHTPGIMVGYQPKCLDFARTIGLERHYIPTDLVDADQLMVDVGKLYASLEQAQQELFEKCGLMKRRLEAFARRVMDRFVASNTTLRDRKHDGIGP